MSQFDRVRPTRQLCEWFPDPAPRPKVTCDSLPFVTFLTFCSKIFSSVLLSPSRHKIWCHSLIKFVRLRSFPVIHRVLAIISPRFSGCSSLIEFDAVRSNPQLCEWFPDSAPRPKVNCDSLPFVTFLTFCSKIFSSVLLSSRRREIWCRSLFEFDRVRIASFLPGEHWM